jgi:drug/metabolite transporter (DMT)-like permease
VVGHDVFLRLQPVVGVLLAWLMLGERIPATALIGGVLAQAVVGLTTTRPAPSAGERRTTPGRPSP